MPTHDSERARPDRCAGLTTRRRHSARLALSGITAGFTALLAGACEAGAPSPTPSPTEDGERAAVGELVRSSDPELRRLATELLPTLEERSGLPLESPVRIERRSRPELVRYLTAKLDEELPADEAARAVRVYALLGLVEPELDLRALLLDLYTEQVAGFYEPDSTALYVMDDQPADALEGLLAHELVHAIQDQSVSLGDLTDASLGNDRAAAAHAAVEGHATLVMLELMMERMTGNVVDLAEMPELADQLLPALDGMAAQFPALGSAPPVVQRSVLFPYLHGAAFVQRLWATEGRVAPFGRRLPRSTEQILEHDLDDAPVTVEIDVEGGRLLHQDQLGRLELDVLIETHLGPEAVGLGRGWEGDRYALVLEDGAQDSGLVWVGLWETVAGRDSFLAEFRSALGSFAEPAAVDPLDVQGLPGVLLRIGPLTHTRVEARLAGPGDA